MNIGVLGIGGVGGYFGGLLAAHYADSPEVRVVFIPSPRSVEAIRENGLRLITPEGEKNIHPHSLGAHAEDIGVLNALLCATKSYDLGEALKPLETCITADTLILP